MAVAIEAYRNPSRLLRKQAAPFPDDMLAVIKAAAGDRKTIDANASDYGMAGEVIQEMAKNFLIKQVLDPKATGLRLLGLNAGADFTRVREHKRWLLMWLHPDRNPSSWEQAHFNRISTLNEAALISSEASTIFVEGVGRTQRRKHQRVPPTLHRLKASPAALLFQSLKPLVLIAGLAIATVWLFAAQPNLLAKARSMWGEVAGHGTVPLATGAQP